MRGLSLVYLQSPLPKSKEDETGCVTCTGDDRTVHRMLIGKPEFKRKLKNLKVGGSLRKELILKKQDRSAGDGFIWLNTGTV